MEAKEVVGAWRYIVNVNHVILINSKSRSGLDLGERF